MQVQQAKTIYLKDYKPSSFFIESVELNVDIFHDKTIVKNKMKIVKSSSLINKPTHLELNGEQVVLKKIQFNGEELKNEDYQLSQDKLVILNVKEDEFILEIENEIDPVANKACEGFYQSGDQFCTQCEPEGFRKITYFIDRPDVMAKFKTRMSADRERFPFLLSNGNRVSAGDLPQGRHFVEWEDPFPKPSYLFAMVAGDFDVAHDQFTTQSGRLINLEIYVDKGNLKKTPHAMRSLKKAMKWDEDTFGLEYDLDIYMIVAVDSFNMGAMENKGLNIFNSTYTLADESSATDHDFQNIEGVIGHEYFHNWTGNRITCRDWFQLTLKEGLTVYRDQEFSSDMLSRAVKRLEDVRLLKEGQFPEDAGPLSHPIRPSSYMEINNFYTRTVYEKGAEVIRMIATLIGKESFRKGMDKYFELFDGQAVTTEDFIHAMELASGKSLSQFKNWYSRPGTPTLKFNAKFHEGQYELQIDQIYPPTTHKVPEGNILHMPLNIAFISENGVVEEKKIEMTKLSEKFNFQLPARPVLSLNRGFSAPVHVEYERSLDEYYFLMKYDSDPYCRYEATQKVYEHLLHQNINALKDSKPIGGDLPHAFKSALGELLFDQTIDNSFKSYLLELPSENTMAQEILHPSFDHIHKASYELKKAIGLTFQDWFLDQHSKLSVTMKFDLTPAGYGNRALKNQVLSYLVASRTSSALGRLDHHFDAATNMTEEICGLTQFIKMGVDLNHPAIKSFYKKWGHDSLVMLKWFGAIASHSPSSDSIERLVVLEKDPLFLNQVPNYLRALYVQFARNNLVAFHQLNGRGYDFTADRIIHIDRFNPQVASRASASFSMINRLDNDRKQLMQKSLEKIMHSSPSRDTYEVISKYLSQG